MEEMQSLAGRGNSRRFSVPRKPLVTRNVSPGELPDYRQASHKAAPTSNPKTRLERDGSSPLLRLWEYAWLAEIVSLLLAIIALAAIVITLSLHQNKPLPQWPSLISINALIAIFTAILKAALMLPVAEGISQLKWDWFQRPRAFIDLERIDSASRGPWGSFLLMFSLYKHYLAVLGALITIAALAIDPFSQQVLQYYSCLDADHAVAASITATNNYTKFGVHTSAKDTTLDSAMANALYTGTIDPPGNASSSISFSCSTGNCTFLEDRGATHMSLAMCGSCAEISSQIIRNKTTDSDNATNTYPGFHPYHLDPDPDTYDNVETYGDVSIGTNFGSFWLATRAYWPDYGARYVSAFDALMYRQSSCKNSSTTSCSYEPFAANCEIYPCVNTYWANVTSFVLEERELSSQRVPNATSDGFNFFLVSDTVIRDGHWHDCVASNNATKTNPAAVTTFTSNATGYTSSHTKYYPADCLWNFGGEITNTLQAYFVDNLWGSGSLTNSEIYTPDGAVGVPWLLNMLSNGNASLDTMNRYMDGLANSMTAVMRQAGNAPNTASPTGISYKLETCIHVQWAWLSLPAALILLAAAFLISTILETRPWQMTWKSSALALLFHGLDPNTRETYGALTDIRDMKRDARNAQVQLARPDLGWRFDGKSAGTEHISNRAYEVDHL